jgi:hypothetical protein
MTRYKAKDHCEDCDHMKIMNTRPICYEKSSPEGLKGAVWVRRNSLACDDFRRKT